MKHGLLYNQFTSGDELSSWWKLLMKTMRWSRKSPEGTRWTLSISFVKFWQQVALFSSHLDVKHLYSCPGCSSSSGGADRRSATRGQQRVTFPPSWTRGSSSSPVGAEGTHVNVSVLSLEHYKSPRKQTSEYQKRISLRSRSQKAPGWARPRPVPELYVVDQRRRATRLMLPSCVAPPRRRFQEH